MIIIGFVMTAIGTFLFGYAVGGIIEHRKSQQEIDTLSHMVEQHYKLKVMQ